MCVSKRRQKTKREKISVVFLFRVLFFDFFFFVKNVHTGVLYARKETHKHTHKQKQL